MVNKSVGYGVRWFGVVGLSMALSECICIWVFYDARNHEPKILSKFIFRPDDDPDKGRNIGTKAKYIYTW
jgi:hypothetical protein